MTALIAILIVVLALVGTPLFAVMGLSALTNYWRAEIDLQAVIISFYELTSKPMLQTLPLFAFAGCLLAHSRAPTRLVRLSNAFLGWTPGGLALVAILSCSLMTAFTGASGMTIVALGGVLLPALLENRYESSFSLGTVTAGGSLGLLFAPSLPIILYGVVSGTDVGHLFRAGVLPGLLVVVMLCSYGMWRGWRAGVPRQPFSGAEVWRALWEARWEVPLPIVVIAGIYSGLFAISEAAVIAAAYVLIVELFLYRDIRVSELGRIARESVVLTGGILIILGLAIAVTGYLIDAEVPQQFFELFAGRMTGRVMFLVVLNLFLLLVGCMIDIYAAIVLIVPLIMPIALEFDVHPVHLGIVFLANLGIGYITPPVGLNLFIASIRFRKPVLSLYLACLPFFFLLLLALILITYVPQLSLFLVPR